MVCSFIHLNRIADNKGYQSRVAFGKLGGFIINGERQCIMLGASEMNKVWVFQLKMEKRRRRRGGKRHFFASCDAAVLHL